MNNIMNNIMNNNRKRKAFRNYKNTQFLLSKIEIKIGSVIKMLVLPFVTVFVTTFITVFGTTDLQAQENQDSFVSEQSEQSQLIIKESDESSENINNTDLEQNYDNYDKRKSDYEKHLFYFGYDVNIGNSSIKFEYKNKESGFYPHHKKSYNNYNIVNMSFSFGVYLTSSTNIYTSIDYEEESEYNDYTFEGGQISHNNLANHGLGIGLLHFFDKRNRGLFVDMSIHNATLTLSHYVSLPYRHYTLEQVDRIYEGHGIQVKFGYSWEISRKWAMTLYMTHLNDILAYKVSKSFYTTKS